MSSISEKEALAAARNAEQLREKELRAKEWEALKLEREARKKEEERLEEIERKRLAEVHFQQEKQVPCPVCLLKSMPVSRFKKKNPVALSSGRSHTFTLGECRRNNALHTKRSNGKSKQKLANKSV